MAFGDDVLGTDYLPPSPLYPIDSLVAPAPALAPPTGPVSPSATGSTGAPASGLNVALRPPAASTAASPTAISGIDLNQILGILRQSQQPSGFMPNFMASLGAGLSSAGQNWNKPAMAAFASGAGAAIQGGQALQQQQQKDRLALVNLALHAWQIGDMATYHKALIKLRAAGAASAAAQPVAPAPPGAAAPPLGDTAQATR
jgi:hypothetical protein